MSDLDELQEALRDFYQRRDWRKFQTPKDLAASLAVEAAELQELFLWRSEQDQERVASERRSEIEDELADVLINCLNLGARFDIDLIGAVRTKLSKLETRYPVEEVKGKVM